jgi:hypothetical protein
LGDFFKIFLNRVVPPFSRKVAIFREKGGLGDFFKIFLNRIFPPFSRKVAIFREKGGLGSFFEIFLNRVIPFFQTGDFHGKFQFSFFIYLDKKPKTDQKTKDRPKNQRPTKYSWFLYKNALSHIYLEKRPKTDQKTKDRRSIAGFYTKMPYPTST